MKKVTDSRRKFGLDGNGNPNYGWEVVGFFSLNNQSLTRSWPLDWRGYFEQGIKWHALLSLDFGLGLWRLPKLWLCKSRGRGSSWPKVWTLHLAFGGFHTMPNWRLHLLYFIGYFQLISLNSQQSLATQLHGLSTWTAIMWTGPKSPCLLLHSSDYTELSRQEGDYSEVPILWHLGYKVSVSVSTITSRFRGDMVHSGGDTC
jgi:hypothetical protein